MLTQTSWRIRWNFFFLDTKETDNIFDAIRSISWTKFPSQRKGRTCLGKGYSTQHFSSLIAMWLNQSK